MIKLIIGLVILIGGILFGWLIVSSTSISPLIKDNPIVETRQCMTQAVHVMDTVGMSESPFIIIGEVVICGSDWKISNIYGPNAETFYGRIKLRDWDSEEFPTE